MKRLLSLLILLFFLITTVPIVIGSVPQFTDVYPSNDATNVPINDINLLKFVTITINITDSDGDLKYFNVETNKTGEWVSLTSFEFPTTVTYQFVSTRIYNCSFATKYWWRVSARDDAGNWTNQTFSFTTQQSQNGSGGQGGEGENQTGNISIFPSTPTSGKMFAVILDKPSTVNGYLWIQDTMYPIAINNGFGTVQTDKEVYGDALIWLYGGKQKTFTISCGLTGTLSLDVPEAVSVDTAVDIKVKISGKLVGTAEVILIDPSGASVTANTTNGILNHVFSKVGTWLVRTSFIGQNDVKEVRVDYKPLDVNINDNRYISGGDVRVMTEQNAVVEISREGVIKIQSIATNGVVMFTPREPGWYKVTATLGNKRGSVDFEVYQDAKIKVFDIDTNAQVVNLKTDKMYMVKVVDSKDQPLYDFNQITTSELASSQPTLIQLNGGIGFWTPKVSGNVILHLPEMEGYVTEDLSINVIGELNLIILFIVIGIIALVLVLLVLFRSKLPQGLREKFKLKPKREIPI